MTLLTIALLTALTATPAMAATDGRVTPLAGYSHRSWTDFDDYHQPRAVYAITQDSDGYIWLGFLDGLVRFDGARFVKWEALHRPTLPGQVVTALAGARDGSLWIGFGNLGGIAHYSAGILKHYPPRDVLRRGAIRQILEDHEGTIWAGGYTGLARFRQDRWERLDAARYNLPEGTVHLLYEDPQRRLWVGNPSGLYRRDPGRERFERVSDPTSVPRAFGESAANAPWQDAVRDLFTHFDPTLPPTFLRDTRGEFWAAGGSGVLHVRTSADNGPRPFDVLMPLHGLTDAHASALFEDREGNIWIGTEVGLDLLAPRKPAPFRGIPALADHPVTALAADAGNTVWAGTNGGLYRVSPTGVRQYSTRDGLPSDQVQGLHRDAAGTLWVLTERGIARLADGRLLAVPLPADVPISRIESFTIDADGGIWLCGSDDLIRVTNGVATRIADDGIAERRPRVVFADSGGRVWVGFWEGGVVAFHGGRLERYQEGDGLASGRVTSIYEDSDHRVWVGTLGGVSRFDNGRFASFPDGSGVAHLMVTAMVEDGRGRLWLNALSGVVRFDRGELDKALRDPSYRVQQRPFDAADGLEGSFTWSGASSATRATNGELWFGRRGGVAVIDPGGADDRSRPPVRIEQVLADDRAFEPSRNLRLPANTSRVQIDFASLTFASPARPQFRYKLDGFDRDWVDAGRLQQAFYTNLGPRQYSFRVAASRDGSTWNEAANVVEFSILPAFYQTASFYLGCAAALVLMVWGAWRWRLHGVRRQYSLVLAERARLGREIHDTLLQGMVGVALQIHGIAETLSPAAETVKERLDRARDCLEHYIRETRVSIWDLRSPVLDTRDLAAALREVGETITAGSPARFELSVRGKPTRCAPRVEEHLLRIGQEAIANAVRHANPTTIAVELSYDAVAVRLRVHDDGHGFDPQDVGQRSNNSWGLTSMRERAQQIGARFRCASSQADGTEIEAVAPLPAN